MQKPRKVPDKARVDLCNQQIALIDLIEELTRGNEIEWNDYVEATTPEIQRVEGKLTFKSTHNISLDYIKAFRDCVFSGVTPPAAILVLIGQFFDRYLEDTSGKLSLEEAFKFRPKEKIGNPLKQEEWLLKKQTVLLGIWLQKKITALKGKKISIEKAASIVINELNLDANEESLKKEYKKFEIAKSQESGFYPPTQECISDLEKAFKECKQLYDLRLMPKSKEPILGSRDSSKEFVKQALSLLIENSGKK